MQNLKVILDTFDDKKVRTIMILKIYTAFVKKSLALLCIQEKQYKVIILWNKNEFANIISNEPLAMKNNYVVHLRPSRLDV